MRLTSAGLQTRNRQSFGGFTAVELVGFGQQHQKFQAFFDLGTNHFQQNFVEFGQAQARIAHQDHAFEVVACHQIVSHHPLPAHFVRFGNGGISVTRQIGQHRIGLVLPAQGEQIDVLRAPRLFGGIGQLPLLCQDIDAGGFTGVGATDKGNFRLVIGR